MSLFHSILTPRIFSCFLVPALLIATAEQAISDDMVGDDGKKIYEVHAIAQDVFRYRDAVKGFDIYDKTTWKDMDLNRMDLEILIFHVAPILGGCNCEINMQPYQVHTPHSRSVEQVRMGEDISHPVTIFSGDSRAQDGFYLSRSILDPADFFVGLYTYEGRKDILDYDKNSDFRELTFVAASNWEIDNRMIAASGAKHVMSDNWQSALSMIIAGRADVIMQPFQPTDDLSFFDESLNAKFVPIPNVKMPFPQGRVYFVSKAHPDGKVFVEALNRGIAAIDGDDDFLRKAHVQAGVINPVTQNYYQVFPYLADELKISDAVKEDGEATAAEY